MRRLLPRALALFTVVTAGLALTSSSTPAAAAATCTITQITDTIGGAAGGNFAQISPVISRNGAVIAFSSDRNHTSANPDGNQEIFRYVIATDGFSQLTATTGGVFSNTEPAINADGTDIAFETDRNINATNPDNSREIYRWFISGMVSAVSPVTTTTGGQSGAPTINSAGDRIAFISDANIGPGTNGDGNKEIFLFRTAGSAITQVTNTTGGTIDAPDLDSAGKRLVFASNRALGGSNADLSPEIFLYDVVTAGITAQTVTSAPVTNHSPALNGNGRRIAFASSGNFAGRNPDGSEEIFLRETSAGTTTAMTSGAGGTFGPGGPAINGAGSRILIETDDDLLGNNTDGGFEVFVRDLGGPGQRTLQLTDTGGLGAGEVDVSASGSRAVFSSRQDITGDNGDENREIFLATCSAPPVPVLCDGQLVTVDRGRGQQPTTATDVIRGTQNPDTVSGRQGNDRFCGLNGNDTFNGGSGNDRVFGQNGNDRLRGDGDNDFLDGGPNADTLNGGGGPDTCKGGPGPDTATQCTVRLGIP